MEQPLTLAQQLRKLAEARRKEDEDALAQIRTRATHDANEGRFQTSWSERISNWLHHQLTHLGFEMVEAPDVPDTVYIMW